MSFFDLFVGLRLSTDARDFIVVKLSKKSVAVLRLSELGN
jgi:hypothetical protein